MRILAITGPEFLAAYAVALACAITWSAFRTRNSVRSFSRSGPTELDDPFELAYLAGGALRVTEVGVIRLIAQGILRWTHKWTGARLTVCRETLTPNVGTQVENNIITTVGRFGPKGMPANQLVQGLAPSLRPIEVRLATLGLRPTSAERTSAWLGSTWPLIVLAAVGVFRILFGLSRDRPVGFLVVFVFITAFVAFFMAKRIGYLTASGRSLLESERHRHRDRRSLRFDEPALHLPEIAYGVALFGPSAVAGIPGFEAIHHQIAAQMGADSSSSTGTDSAVGCSSGCSSGCGGCGGCGD